MKILEETDLMPFGKHKGAKMYTIPNSYLRWLWLNVTTIKLCKTLVDRACNEESRRRSCNFQNNTYKNSWDDCSTLELMSCIEHY